MRHFPTRVVVTDRRDDVGIVVIRAHDGGNEIHQELFTEEETAKAGEKEILLAQIDAVLGEDHRRAVAHFRRNAGDAAKRRGGRMRHRRLRHAHVEHDQKVIEPAQAFGDVEDRRITRLHGAKRIPNGARFESDVVVVRTKVILEGDKCSAQRRGIARVAANHA